MIHRTPKRPPLIAAARIVVFTAGVALYAGLALGAVVVAGALLVPPALVAIHVFGRL